MDLPVKFPGAAEKLAQEVYRYRDASADERIEALFELFDLCESLLTSSPYRSRQLQLLAENEEAEHRALRAVILKHALGPDRHLRAAGPGDREVASGLQRFARPGPASPSAFL